MDTVLVTGARGQTGRQVVRALAAQTNFEIRGATRNPTEAGEVLFDWADRNTWGAALEGATALYLVKPVVEPDGVDVIEALAALLGQASSVRRVVLLSEIGAGERDENLNERQAELLLERSHFQWTILRPHWFMQNFVDTSYYLSPLRDAGMIAVPTGGRAASFVDTRDIADVAVQALTSSRHAKKHYTLTGSAAYRWADAVACISHAAGYEMNYIDVPLEEFIAQLSWKRLPKKEIDHRIEVYKFLRSEASSQITDDIEQVLHRKPRTFEAFVKENETLWKRSPA